MTRYCHALLGVALLAIVAMPLPAREIQITPVSNHGRPWRIALYQGGPLVSYQDALYFLAQRLMQLDWLPETEIPRPADNADTRALWRWLATELDSEFLAFREDAFYSAEWIPHLRALNRRAIIERLLETDDIDLVIAMGTWAGQDLATSAHGTPITVVSVSDALAAGIVESVEDSGFDHVHAFLNPERYLLQVRLFHAIMGFERLGVVFEDTVEGRSYAAMDNIEEVAGTRGFGVISCRAPFSGVTDQQAAENVRACHEQLAPQVDAMYIAVHRGVTIENAPWLLEPLLQFQIPTFAQSTSEYVKRGVLFSISQASRRYEGEFYAETIAKILNGAAPRTLGQVFEDPPKIAINLKTAEIIGYDPPVDVLGAADEIFQQIHLPR